MTKLQLEQREAKRQKRLARFEQVKQLHQVGTPLSVIARQLGLNRTTVRTYLRAEQVPEVRHPYHKPNPAQRYEDYLRRR